MTTIDFEKTVQDYVRYRAGFPKEIFRRLKAYGIGKNGQRILDIGTGTGTLARGFALQGCQVTALDPSSLMVRAARYLDEEAGATVHYLRAQAEQTGLASQSFDVVTAGQCWHWFERKRAANEIWRLLVRGGSLVIAHFDWVALPGNVVEATLRLIRDYNPNWQPIEHNLEEQGVYPMWLRDVAIANYSDIETFSFDVDVKYTHEAWRGRIRASAGVAASMAPEIVVQFDSTLKDMLWMNYAADPMTVPHRVWVLVCHT